MAPQSRRSARTLTTIVVIATAVTIGVVLLLFAITPARAVEQPPERVPVQPADQRTSDGAIDGADLYATQCVSCHGVDATGVEGNGPDITNEGEAAVDFVLRTGRMPLSVPEEQAYRRPTRYTDAEIEALVAYAGTLGDGPAIPDVDIGSADLVNGGVVFRLNCAACHVASGSGSVIGSDRRAPSLAQPSPTVIGEAIIVGPGAMPVFDHLSAEEISDVALYVVTMQEDDTTGYRALGGIGPVAEGLAAWFLALIPMIVFTRWIGTARTPDAEAGGDHQHEHDEPASDNTRRANP